MRKIALFIACMYIIHPSYPQLDWAPNGAEWYYSIPNDKGNPLFDYERFTYEADSLIKGVNCKIIRSSYNKEIMFMEDNKVYYLFNDGFKLLYDFGAMVDDTINFEFKSFKFGSFNLDTTYSVKCVVEKIDTIISNGRNLKKYETRILPRADLDFIVWDPSYNYTERIGYEYDFMYVLPIASLGFMRNLRCYNDKNINFVTEWWTHQDKKCDYKLPTTIINSNSQNEEFYLFPNPGTYFINIRKPNKLTNKDLNVCIHDIAGKKVYSSILYNMQTTIDLSTFRKGAYFVIISSNQYSHKPLKFFKL